MTTRFPIVFLSLFLALSFFSGCTHLRDLTPEEFRKPEFYNETIELKTTIKDIQKIYPFYRLNYIYEHAKINVAPHKAVVWWVASGWVQPATMAMIDFEQKDLNVPHVTAKIYSANPFWRDKHKRLIDMIRYKMSD